MSGIEPAAPADLDVDSAGVLDFLDAAARARLELHGLAVVRSGRLVVDAHWGPYPPGRRRLVYSLSKTLTAAAIGVAVGQGLLTVDDPVLEHLGDLAPADRDPFWSEMRVRHLLSMSTGHETDPIERLYRAVAGGRDPVAAFLAMPPDHAPGEVFTYNQGATLLLSAIISRLTGRRLCDYLLPDLLEPLGIGPIRWDRFPDSAFPAGLDQGFTGAYLSTREIATIGELLRCAGNWRGRQLIPADYVAQMHAAQIGTRGRALGGDWSSGYGYQTWRSRNGTWRGDGACGQFCIVAPEQQAVIAITASTIEMGAELKLVWTHLLPALGRGGSADADSALAQRLESLTIAMPPVGREVPTVRGAVVTAPVEAWGRADWGRVDVAGDVLTWRHGADEYPLRLGRGQWLDSRLTLPGADPGDRSEQTVWCCSGSDATGGPVVRLLCQDPPHSATITLPAPGDAAHEGAGQARFAWDVSPFQHEMG